jgi:succinate dehydrogenase / fumarate reductase, cytochrome b subunit
MSWISTFLTSSIGRKLIMSLTGLFLILFLVVHLIGNLQLLSADEGRKFNEYAHFMTSNPLIKGIAYGNYFFIILHAIIGIMLWSKNRAAKGVKPAVGNSRDVTWASKNMALLGTLILAFIFLHMGDFWWKMKFGQVDLLNYDGSEVKDLYSKVAYSFSQLWIVVAYIIGLAVLGFHLNHGFASAFQTLGLSHNKYTPIIKGLGTIFSIIVPSAYAIIPIIFYFFR